MLYLSVCSCGQRAGGLFGNHVDSFTMEEGTHNPNATQVIISIISVPSPLVCNLLQTQSASHSIVWTWSFFTSHSQENLLSPWR